MEPMPERLIGDKMYDSDPLDACLAAQRIAMIAPYHRDRTKPKTQDGRRERRDTQRRKIAQGALCAEITWLGDLPFGGAL